MCVLVVYSIIGLSKAMAEEEPPLTSIAEEEVSFDLDFNKHILSSDLYFSSSNYVNVSNPYYNKEDNKKIGQDLVDNMEMFIGGHDTGKRFRLKVKVSHRLEFKKITAIWRIHF